MLFAKLGSKMSSHGNNLPDILGAVGNPQPAHARNGEGPPEEEHVQALPMQQVGTNCPYCQRQVNIIVVSTAEGLRQLLQLLLSDNLAVVCSTCARERIRRQNGR